MLLHPFPVQRPIRSLVFALTMISSTRRQFLKTGTKLTVASTALAAIPGALAAQNGVPTNSVSLIDDPLVKQLTLRGLDAVRAAGATYADIRLTHQLGRSFAKETSTDGESMTVGVRALVNGYWGFASSPVWTGDEMVRLARAAVSVAKTNALGKPRSVVLAPTPVVRDGHWTMPIKIDPFDVPRAEVFDFMGGLQRFAEQWTDWNLTGKICFFTRLDKAFGSTDGAFWTQRTYKSSGGMAWDLTGKYLVVGAGLNDYLSPAGLGWELFLDQPLREGIRQLHEELKEDASFPLKPVDVGRYDAVVRGDTLVSLLGGSVGAATQLDRVMGYEANASGTSYITDPGEMLGSFKIGSPLLTVQANRSSPGDCATVKWDDESVEPEEFTLVNGGVLTDFQTTRESAEWMREWQKIGNSPSRSHGCANAPQAVDVPLTHTPNLVMAPGREKADFTSMVAGMENGIALKRGSTGLDFQQLNGYGSGATYEVKNGKRVACIAGAGFLLRAPEFWNSLLAVGGPESVIRYGTGSGKGEPPQGVSYSVSVVPVVVKDLTIIDRMRKA